jgi:hypothetical protein
MTPTSSKTKSTSSTPATSISVPEGKLDLYAPKFVPTWLKNINSLPPLRTIHSPPPAYVNYEEYAQTFLPNPLFFRSPSTQFLKEIRNPRYGLSVSPLGPQIPLARLDLRNYATHFRNGLIEERRALAEEFKQHNLFEVQLELAPWQNDMFKLSVPGLREYIPAIFVADTVIIRAIRLPINSPVACFDGTEYIAYIWTIDRMKVRTFLAVADLKETLVLHLPELARMNGLLYNIPVGFNVQFYPRNSVETYQMVVADFFAQRLTVDDWSQRMLFPEESHAIWLPERELGQANFDLKWIDKELNYEQQVFSTNSWSDFRNP